LTLAQIEAELSALGGNLLDLACSRLGRPVRGVHFPGVGPGVLVTGGQHANETSGVVAALRAACRLKSSSGRAFSVVPLENPDGYALHGQLCAVNPRHMHHAARYTAMGDDLEYRSREPACERAARVQGARLAEAILHVNLHGYPAHEWTRPLTGYSPRGFEAWSLPKGFFLVLRHRPGDDEVARRYLAALTGRLAEWPELVVFNRRQLAAYRAHAGDPPFEVINDVPCQVTVRADQIVPFTLLTEHPDETIHGESFRFAHEVQSRTVLAAFEALPILAR
jgi:hypothetical protein